MKKIVLFATAFVFCFVCNSAYSTEWIGLNSLQPKISEVVLVSNSVQGTVLKLNLNGFNKKSVSTPKGFETTISFPGGSSILAAGAPDLAKITASVIIPDQMGTRVTVTHSIFQEFTGINIAPSKGNLYRNTDPSSVSYLYGPAYSLNSFYPGTLAELRDPYILRDFRGQTVVIYPFQYNPVTKVLRVYSDITVSIEVDPSAVDSKNQFLRTAPVGIASREFQSVYASHFKNPPAVQYNVLAEQGNMLIIADATYMSSMEPFISWKKRKGIPVEMVDMATVGSTEADIKLFVSNYYNTNGLTYLLLVGDYQDVPSPLQSLAQTGGASDPSYGYISGSDSYAEVFVGRLSAQSVADVETQVQRVLNYEMTPIPGAAYYSKGVGVASDQGPGDDNEYDFEHVRNIRTDLLGFTYTDVAELYDGSQGGMDATGDPDHLDLFNEFQNGISIVNYTGHGSATSCGTTGFSTNDVANLTNYNMLPFFWSVACVNGEFNTGTCLAEALLRAQSGGQPTGAIATMMSSVNQSWNPPMDGQDEMVDLLVGASVNHTMRTFSGISVNGCMHMNDEYGSAGDEMTDTWHCFGDPSLEVRTAAPSAMTVSHLISVSTGTSQLSVTCNTDSAFVSLTINGEIIGTGMVVGGVSNITFSSLTQIDSIDVTVTAFNKVPYMGIVDITGSGVGVTDINSGYNHYSVYPSPANEKTFISLNVSKSEKITVVVYDEQGKKINTIADKVFSKGKHSLQLNTSDFEGGNYYCRITSSSGIINKTFSVLK